ncbi:MAG TPA: hypothetical protein VHB02_14095 [Acidimicrobiales bacterium]|nr:hypothetical protein [Acidimicrobiales bacterium]
MDRTPPAADRPVPDPAEPATLDRPRRGPRRRPRRRRWPAVVGAVAVLLVAYAVVTVVFFVRPDLGTVRRPQAVVVLGGYGDRLQRGIAVAHAHHVPVLELSGYGPEECPVEPGLQVRCFIPHPRSTQGEARAIAAIARTRHWDRLLVVAGTTQVSRARLRIDRCYRGQTAFADLDPTGFGAWVHFVAYDQAAMVKALVWQWGC